MSRPVKRGVFKRSCGRCGWAGTYDTVGKAEYARRRHACGRRMAKVARSAAYAERMAEVDRTPQPCLHPRANHRHGTPACYVLDKCRCLPCTKSNSARENERNRLKAYGRYDKYVDADQVREHLANLKSYGIGLKRVSELSGVSNGSLTKIWYGLYASSEGPSQGCQGPGDLLRGPSRRVLRTTADRIYAIKATPANLGTRGPDLERTEQARTHARALVALGWSMTSIGTRIGMKHPRNVIKMITEDAPLARTTVDRIEALYAELSMTLPPATNQRERISVSRAKKYAREHGWVPPLALDDEPYDAFDIEPVDLDEVAVQRALDGDLVQRLTTAERFEVVRRAQAAGWSYSDIERRAGIAKPDRYIDREDVAS